MCLNHTNSTGRAPQTPLHNQFEDDAILGCFVHGLNKCLSLFMFVFQVRLQSVLLGFAGLEGRRRAKGAVYNQTEKFTTVQSSLPPGRRRDGTVYKQPEA